MKIVKKYLRHFRQLPARLKSFVHSRIPGIFGFETSNAMVQFYRNDTVFKTLVSFNHFIEFFTEYPDLEIEVVVRVYSRIGIQLSPANFHLKQGAKQFFLEQLVPDLDEYGIFSLEFKLHPRYVEELNFLQKLSCQFMTIYVPQDELSAPQMIHSHKEIQGKVWVKRELLRKSNSIEQLKDLSTLQFYFLNPSRSPVQMRLVGIDLKTRQPFCNKSFLAQPYSCNQIELADGDFSTIENIYFIYQFNRNISHKKPILFRKFRSNQWSCNHT